MIKRFQSLIHWLILSSLDLWERENLSAENVSAFVTVDARFPSVISPECLQ